MADIKTAATRPTPASLIDEAIAGLKSNAAIRGLGKAGINLLEGIGGMAVTLPESVINLGVPGIKLPGSFSKEAPKTRGEALDNLIKLVPGVVPAREARDAALKDGTIRVDAQGKPVNTSEYLKGEMIGAGVGLGEMTGIRPLYRALTDADHLKEDDRWAQGYQGGLGVLGTLLSFTGATKTQVGKATLTKQLSEIDDLAKKVQTADDLAKKLGIESGTDVIEVVKGNKTLDEAQTSVIERLRTKMKKIDPSADLGNTKTIDNLDNPQVVPLNELEDIATKTIEAAKKSFYVDGFFENAAGVVGSNLDGTPAFVPLDTLGTPIGQRFMSLMKSELMLDNNMMKMINETMQTSDILANIITKNPDFLRSHQVTMAIQNGALGPKFLDTIADAIGATRGEAQTLVAQHYLNTAMKTGEKLGSIALDTQAMIAFQRLKGWFGDEEAAALADRLEHPDTASAINAQLDIDNTMASLSASIVEGVETSKQLNTATKARANSRAKAKRAATQQSVSDSKIYDFLINTSKLSTASLLGTVSYVTRNFLNTSVMNTLSGFEDMMVNGAQRIAGKFVPNIGNTLPFEVRRNAIANVTQDFLAAQIKSTDLYAASQAAMKAIPSAGGYLYSSPLQIMGGLTKMKALGIPMVDKTYATLAKTLTAISSFHELPTRQGVWTARVVKNFDFIDGVKLISDAEKGPLSAVRRMELLEEWATNPTEFYTKYNFDEATQTKFNTQMRQSLADAQIHTQKMQLSFQTETVKNLLDTWHKIPFADVVGPAFPKMLFNIYRHMVEHNPMKLLAAMTPEGQTALLQGLDNGFKTASAQRAYAQATSGMAQFLFHYMAHAGKLSPIGIQPGARPYEYKIQDTSVDTRALAPFDKWAVMGWMAHQIFDRKLTPEQLSAEMSTSEMADFFLSQRRIADMPLLSIDKIFQDFTSGDAERMSKIPLDVLGEFMGRFAVPLANVKLVTDILRPQDQTPKDQAGDELAGPFLSRIPFSSEFMQDRIDPTTGKPVEVENTLMRPILSVAGVKIDKQPKLAEYLRSINYPVHKLVGNNGSPELDRAVAIEVGTLLNKQQIVDANTPRQRTMTLGDLIIDHGVKTLTAAYSPNNDPTGRELNPADLRSELDAKFFSKLRTKALEIALAKNPEFVLQRKVMMMDDLTPSQKAALIKQLYTDGTIQTVKQPKTNRQEDNTQNTKPK